VTVRRVPAGAIVCSLLTTGAAGSERRKGTYVDSPTQADALYRSMGWETDYVTESWFKDVDAG
jgi:hypothetical protein